MVVVVIGIASVPRERVYPSASYSLEGTIHLQVGTLTLTYSALTMAILTVAYLPWRCSLAWRHFYHMESTMHLPYISHAPPMHLPCTSHTSPMHLQEPAEGFAFQQG